MRSCAACSSRCWPRTRRWQDIQKIFENCCREREIAFDPALVHYLIEHVFRPRGIPPRGCHPRDLIDQALAHAAYAGEPRVLTRELLEAACASYFVDEEEGIARNPPASARRSLGRSGCSSPRWLARSWPIPPADSCGPMQTTPPSRSPRRSAARDCRAPFASSRGSTEPRWSGARPRCGSWWTTRSSRPTPTARRTKRCGTTKTPSSAVS